MTKMIFALCLLGSSAAMALPSSSEMKENFATCSTSSPNWYQRFGQYVVSFDLHTASNICRSTTGSSDHQEARAAGCRVGGQWLYAGYFCEDVGP